MPEITPPHHEVPSSGSHMCSFDFVPSKCQKTLAVFHLILVVRSVPPENGYCSMPFFENINRKNSYTCLLDPLRLSVPAVVEVRCQAEVRRGSGDDHGASLVTQPAPHNHAPVERLGKNKEDPTECTLQNYQKPKCVFKYI